MSSKQLTAADRKKGLEIIKTAARKKWGNEIIIDAANMPEYDVISFGSYKLDATSGIGGIVRRTLNAVSWRYWCW